MQVLLYTVVFYTAGRIIKACKYISYVGKTKGKVQNIIETATKLDDMTISRVRRNCGVNYLFEKCVINYTKSCTVLTVFLDSTFHFEEEKCGILTPRDCSKQNTSANAIMKRG